MLTKDGKCVRLVITTKEVVMDYILVIGTLPCRSCCFNRADEHLITGEYYNTGFGGMPCIMPIEIASIDFENEESIINSEMIKQLKAIDSASLQVGACSCGGEIGTYYKESKS